MVSAAFKPSTPFSWKHKQELYIIKMEYRAKRCKDLGSVPPKLKPKERRQSQMPAHPPKVYLGQEFPLYHDFEYHFALSAEGTTKDSTICPIITQDQLAQTLATTYVNPKNANFEVSASPNCSPESIVPYMSISFRASLTKGAIETDLVRSLSFNYMMLTTAYLTRLDAVDSKTGFDVESILELTHETDEEQTFPIWSTVDVGVGNVAANQEGLPGTPLESVAFLGFT